MRLFGNAIQQYYGQITISPPVGDSGAVVNQNAATPGILVAASGTNTGYIAVAGGGISAANAAYIGQDDLGDAFFYTPIAGGLFFGTNGAARFAIGNAGACAINGPAPGNVALTVNGVAASPTMFISASAAAGASQGLKITAGTGAGDYNLQCYNAAGLSVFLTLDGSGCLIVGGGLASTGGGTVNASGYYLSGKSQFQSGTFTGTLTGCTTAPTATFDYTISGNICVLTCSTNLIATSNTGGCGITGLPAACQPATLSPVAVCAGMENSGTQGYLGSASVAPGSGTITLSLLSGGVAGAGNWTASGIKGVNAGWTTTYSLQ